MEMKNIRIFAQWTSIRKNIDVGEKYHFTRYLLKIKKFSSKEYTRMNR